LTGERPPKNSKRNDSTRHGPGQVRSKKVRSGRGNCTAGGLEATGAYSGDRSPSYSECDEGACGTPSSNSGTADPGPREPVSTHEGLGNDTETECRDILHGNAPSHAAGDEIQRGNDLSGCSATGGRRAPLLQSHSRTASASEIFIEPTDSSRCQVNDIVPVEVRQSTRGPTKGTRRKALARSGSGVPVGGLQVRPVRCAGSIKVYTPRPQVEPRTVFVQEDAADDSALLSGTNVTLVTKGSCNIPVEPGLFHERDPAVNSSYSDRGPGLGGETIRKPQSEPARIEIATEHEPSFTGGEPVAGGPSSEKGCIFVKNIVPEPWSVRSLTFTPAEWEMIRRPAEDVDIAMNMVSSTAMLNVSITAESKTTKVRARRIPCALPLAPITTNRIRYDRLLSLSVDPHPELLESLDIIVGEKGANFVLKHPDFRSIRGANKTKVSRHLLKEMPDLVDQGTFEESIPTDDDLYVSLFKVPKAGNVNARLIGDCGPINVLLPKPGDMGLKGVREVIIGLLRQNYLLQKDAESCFYQFLMNRRLSELLKVRVGDQRGRFRVYMWRVMTMGLNHAPKMCQRTSNHIAENAKFIANTIATAFLEAWVDNFLFGTRTEADMDALEAGFDTTAEFVNLKMKPNEPKARTMEAIGLLFDVTNNVAARHWVSLAPKQVDIMQTKLDALKPRMTFREFLELFGLSMWANFTVGRRPLVHWCGVLNYVRAGAREMHSGGMNAWDILRDIPHAVVHELANMVRELMVARVYLEDLEFEDSYDHHVWTDAALGTKLMSYVMRTERGTWAAVQSHECESIFVPELLAMCNAVLTVPVGLHLRGDNKAARRALIKGHSTSDAGNLILARLYESLEQPPRVKISYVPTKCNVADAMSRGERWVPLPQSRCTHEEFPEEIRWVC